MSKKVIRMNRLIVLGALLCCTLSSFAQTVCRKIDSSTGDVEQHGAGIQYFDSSDLEFVYDANRGNQEIGLRFNNIQVPRGASIQEAYIQFRADESDTESTLLDFKIELTDNALPFDSTDYSLSSRLYSSTQVSWVPNAWVAGDEGIDQRTPDLSSLVQIIINRSGYSLGNSLVFKITGSGQRVAEAYDSGSSLAPELCITFSCGADDDNDGVLNCDDLCIGFPDQEDVDQDGIPDGCDGCIDINNNGICDGTDSSIPSLIVINEINYRSIHVGEELDFIELYNADDEAVDLSGWHLTDAIEYTFPSGTLMNPGTYLVVAADQSQIQTTFSYAGSYGPMEGRLSAEGETVYLRNSAYVIADFVDYESWKEWPNVRAINSGDSPASIQKINHLLPGNHAGSWEATVPSPGATNSNFNIDASTIPVMKRVTKTPDKPAPSEEMIITSELTNLSGVPASLAVTLEYQINEPGSYVKKTSAAYLNNWTSIAMLDDGMNHDDEAGDGIFTASISPTVQQHRRLIRYRVHVTTGAGYNRIFPDQNHEESNYSYYVYGAYPDLNGYGFQSLSDLNELTVITTTEDADTYIGNGADNAGQYTENEYLGRGTIVYNGKVYDHIRFRPRGGSSRALRIKPGFKVDFNPERPITVQNNEGDEYDVDKDKLVISGTWHNDPASHGLAEALCYQIKALCGAPARHADYTHVRIVDRVTETGNQGDFWGLNLVLENYDAEFLEQHDLPDGNIWSYKPTKLDHLGDFPGAESLGQWTGAEDEFNLPLIARDRVANTIYGQNANNYVGKHSYREYYNPEIDKWYGWWSDLDNAYGSPNDDIVTFTRAQSNVSAQLDNDLIPPADYTLEYKNELRSAYDLLLNTEQADYLIDALTEGVYDPAAPYDWTTVDQSKWGQIYDTGSITQQVDWYKSWLQNRAAFLLSDSNSGIADPDVPATPSITHTGSAALDNLSFSASAFNDPNGNGTFGSMEWRIAEWSDPSNPYYSTKPPKYEIETVWSSGPLGTFNAHFSIPADAQLKTGRTYKVRVRYVDQTGRASHWSNAISFISEAPVNTTAASLSINEFHYNPNDEHEAEFIELKNTGSSTIDLSNVRFSEGIDYEFPEGSSIGPGEFLVLTDEPEKYAAEHGAAAFDAYKGALSNSGETLEIRGDFDVLIDVVTYADISPWTDIPDQGEYSLALVPGSNLDNNLSSNWSTQAVFKTPNAENDFTYGPQDASILINEIHYNPLGGELNEFVEIVNTTESPIQLAGYAFVDGIYFTFELPYTLAGKNDYPDNYLVLAKDFAAFQNSYGFAPYGTYTGKLNNNGELVILRDADGNLADQVNYNNETPWDTNADFSESSLALYDFESNNDLYSSWGTQEELVTPGWRNFEPENTCPVDFTGDGIINVSDFLDLNSNFGIPCNGCVYDLTGDGLVNVSDFLEFNTSYGLSCPTLVTTSNQLQNTIHPSLDADLHHIDEKIIKPELRKEIRKMRSSTLSSSLIINEIHYNPKEWIIGTDTLAGDSLEFLELKNTLQTDLDLTGYEFIEGIQYTFPGGSVIPAGGFLVLASDFDSFQQRYGQAPFAAYSGQLSNSSDTITLIDNTTGGILCDELIYSDSAPWETTADEGYYSLGLLPDVSSNDAPESWDNQSIFFTPGAENIFDDWVDTDLVINEIHYNPADTIIGQDTINGENFEFIEIKNIGSSSYDLNGCLFSKGIDYDFPDGTTIAAGDFIVLAENALSFQLRYGVLPFDQYRGSLSNSGEKIRINAADGTTLDNVKYNDALPWDTQADGGNEDLSLALIDQNTDNDLASNWKVQCTHLYTPGSENDVICTASPLADLIKINEVHYNPSAGSTGEFIEIVNTSSSPVQLQGCAFVEGMTFTFGLSTLLPGTDSYPDNYLVLANNYAFHQFTYGVPPYSQYSDNLSNQGEQIVLKDANGHVIDVLIYDDNSPWDSVPDLGQHSLALLDINLDNDLATSWSHQPQLVTPGWRNFEDENNCPQDLTGDGVIDVSDFLAFNSSFGTTCSNCPADLDGDGDVDVSDFLALNSAYGLTCPTQVTDHLHMGMLNPRLEEQLKQIDPSVINEDLLREIESIKRRIDIQVFPNPSEGDVLHVTIHGGVNTAVSECLITVRDIYGKVIYRQSAESHSNSYMTEEIRFDSPLSSGLYFISIEKNNSSGVAKFTVQ